MTIEDDEDTSLFCDDCGTNVPDGDGHYWPEFDEPDERRLCADCYDKRQEKA